MPLFKKKQQSVIPIITPIEPTYTIQGIQHRVELLLQAEKKLGNRITIFETNTNDLVENNTNRLLVVRNELTEIAKEHKSLKERFASIVRTLSLTAKKEDYEKTKRLIDQYDPADMITREEFERLL